MRFKWWVLLFLLTTVWKQCLQKYAFLARITSLLDSYFNPGCEFFPSWNAVFLFCNHDSNRSKLPDYPFSILKLTKIELNSIWRCLSSLEHVYQVLSTVFADPDLWWASVDWYFVNNYEMLKDTNLNNDKSP